MSADRSTKLCSFEHCERLATRKGLCGGHYQQRKRGKQLSSLKFKRPKGSPPLLRFDEVVCDVRGLKGPCLVFADGKAVNGYGKVRLNGKVVSVHRYVWIQTNGPIPPDKVVDHRCRNRACANMDHLRLVTVQVNGVENVIGAGWQLNAAKLACKHGHEFTEENTRLYRGGRQCRECHLIRQRRYKAEIRKAARELIQQPTAT